MLCCRLYGSCGVVLIEPVLYGLQLFVAGLDLMDGTQPAFGIGSTPKIPCDVFTGGAYARMLPIKGIMLDKMLDEGITQFTKGGRGEKLANSQIEVNKVKNPGSTPCCLSHHDGTRLCIPSLFCVHFLS